MDEAWALPSPRQLARLDRERRFGRPSALRSIRREEELVHRRVRPPALKCLLVGAMVTFLYVWVPEFLAHLLPGGFSSVVFNGLLGAGLVLSTAAAWIITALETRYREQNWTKLPDYADPPPWK